jgi:Domain of unknown function (DUF5916)/Carbohydrate family 9 binding domain-like
MRIRFGWVRCGVVSGVTQRAGFAFAALMMLSLGNGQRLSAQNGSARASTGSAAARGAASVPRQNTEGRFIFDVSMTVAEIQVDGSMTEDAWNDASLVPLPFESNPGNNTPAQVATECRVTFDDEYLYLGCHAFDEHPEAIRAYVTDRDDIAGHDRIVFTLDPFNDARRAFQFGISPLGVQYDAVYAPGSGRQGGGSQGSADPSWDAIWASAGKIVADGYVIEAAIPFKSLRFPSPEGVQTWGFHVTRDWPRSERVVTRSMFWDRSDSCELCQSNLLEGFDDIDPGTNIEFAPTFTSARTDSRSQFPDGDLGRGSVDPQFGLDARWGITTDIALNATVNPDFSQVEADVAQLDVNNRFALFFPEKRPFFLEGADFFNTPIQALFTRSIADPSLGSKLTGKMGSRAGGLLVARDLVNNLVIPGDQFSTTASLDETVTTIAGRVRQDVGESSNIGALVVGREGENGYFNRVVGIDANLRVLPALTAQFQFLRSETRYARSFAEQYGQTTDQLGGNAATLRLRYNTRNWGGGMNASNRDPGFRTDAGFTPQVDWRDVGGWINRRFWAEDTNWYTSINVSGGFWHQENTRGRLTEEGLWTNLQYNGPLQSTVWVNPRISGEHLDGIDYNGLKGVWFGGQIRPTGSFGLEFNGSVREAVDIGNRRAGHVVQLNPGVSMRIGRRVDLRLTQSFFDMNTSEGADVLTARISQLRAVYNFSPRSFFRAIVQYSDTDRDPETNLADVNRSTSSLFSQFLFSYKVNPQTVLFLGYTDSRDGQIDPDFNRVPLTQTGRSFFLKLGYAWRP